MTDEEALSVLRDYVIEGRVGSGASGTVYRARGVTSGEVVAIKVLAPELAADTFFVDSFRAEASLMAGLRSPNCVRFVELLEQEGLVALVSEFVDGVSLRALIERRGRLSAEQALGVLSGALEGLAALHVAGIVHRDIKPENILVDRSGTSKLVDFGLARPVAALAERPGESVGSPAYMSPEQVNGEEVGPASDVYACGALLFELLTGTPPFAAASIDELLGAHASTSPPDPRVLEPTLPEGVARLVTRALSKDPASRPDNAEAFLVSLREAANEGYGANWHGKATLAGAVAATALAAGAGVGIAGGLGGAAGVSSGVGAVVAGVTVGGTTVGETTVSGAAAGGASTPAASSLPQRVISSIRSGIRAIPAHPVLTAAAVMAVIGAGVGIGVVSTGAAIPPTAATAPAGSTTGNTGSVTITTPPDTGPTIPPPTVTSPTIPPPAVAGPTIPPPAVAGPTIAPPTVTSPTIAPPKKPVKAPITSPTGPEPISPPDSPPSPAPPREPAPTTTTEPPVITPPSQMSSQTTRCMDDGDANMYVYWLPPTSDGGSPITEYRVTAYDTQFHTFSATVLAAANATQVRYNSFQSLQPLSTYMFAVAAVNSAGTGNPVYTNNSCVFS